MSLLFNPGTLHYKSARETGTHTKLEKQARSYVGSLLWFPLSSDRVAKSNYKLREILEVYFGAKFLLVWADWWADRQTRQMTE